MRGSGPNRGPPGTGKANTGSGPLTMLIERLKGVRSERVKAEGAEIEIHTQADDQQRRILNLIGGPKSQP